MITKDQIATLSKKYSTNETTIFRQYMQLLFLNQFYSSKKSGKVFFKGGTAIHLIFKAPRFSEDLDFTVNEKESTFLTYLGEVFKKLAAQESIEIREKKTVAGKRFLLIGKPSTLSYETYVNLDFSFREKVIDPQRSIIETDYPVLFTSYIYHLSKEEIFAEKVRALITRKKGRDLYDLWYLLNIGTKPESSVIENKLKYYGIKLVASVSVLKRIDEFSERDFVLDVRPFVPLGEREKLPEFFLYICDFLKKRLQISKG